MAPRTDPSCLFCRIISGQSPSDTMYQDEQVVAFRDKYPKSPIHVLIVPREHIPTMADVIDDQAGLMGHMIMVANRLARELGIADQGYRLVNNTGPWGGQAIYHVHFHLLGGRRLRWEL